MPKGVYVRTEWHKQICRNNAKIGSRITKFNLPQDTSNDKNGRWTGGKSGGYIFEQCKKVCEKKKCLWCKTDKKLLYHHKDKNRANNDKDNIQVMCCSCHKRLHVFMRALRHSLPITNYGSG
jgi:hypothetical protein